MEKESFLAADFAPRGTSSLVRSAMEFAPTHHSEEIRVSTVTVDPYISEHHLPAPRCVKIDAEESEIRILKGATQLLASEAEILCELHPYAWHAFNNTLAELKELAIRGRRIYNLDQDTEIGDRAEYGSVSWSVVPNLTLRSRKLFPAIKKH